MKIKVAVVEDEELAYKNIQNHLLRYGKEKGQEFEIFYFSNGEKFLNEYELGGGTILSSWIFTCQEWMAWKYPKN